MLEVLMMAIPRGGAEDEEYQANDDGHAEEDG